MLVAYFSMEYGLADCLQIYSGGLGVLSGDHLKASSDAHLPLVGVGLFYQLGYLRQSLDPDGWQVEHTPVNDFYSVPATPLTQPDGSEMLVSVNLMGTEVFLKVWQIDVGRVRLFLLDSNVPYNADPAHRDITNQLYGGDLHKRIKQEIVLGIGGQRALNAVGLQPTVFHMNEGHSAFQAVERIRLLMTLQRLSFTEAVEASRANNVFTTHTSVPAGIDLFGPDLMRQYFQAYCEAAAIPFEELLALGRRDSSNVDEHFSMAIAAFRTSAYRNAVSKLHCRVSQEMWQDLWPQLPVDEVPITSVTNGVHLPTWITGELADLYDRYLRPDWREGHHEADLWHHVLEIPDSELWEAHRRRKRRLVAFVRERSAQRARARNAPASEIKRLQDVLHPEALTIGFARRFATYKRATLFFRDIPRLKRILTNPDRPVQIVIAGKAHPADGPGKNLIREIVQWSHEADLANHVVFVEDYSMEVARELVGGVDLWLNTPRRGEEACGTSGMKAGLNGVLNFSILDGWFDEADEASGGWPIGDREPYSPDRDDAHASGLYSSLEDEIVPLYYAKREHGVPVGWVARVKKSLQCLSVDFNCQRMVEEYGARLYEPAHHAFGRLSADHFKGARDKARWNSEVVAAWPRVSFESCSMGQSTRVLARTHIPVEAVVDLAGLKPGDVRVEAVVGPVSADGQLENIAVLVLAPAGEANGLFKFHADYVPGSTGRLGFSVRITPNHFDSPLNRTCNAPIKWAN